MYLGTWPRLSRREERRHALRDWLADQDREHGAVPDDVMREVRRQWLGADSVAS